MTLMFRRVCRPLAWIAFVGGLVATAARAESGSGAEVHIVDVNLRAAIEKALGVQSGYAIRQSEL